MKIKLVMSVLACGLAFSSMKSWLRAADQKGPPASKPHDPPVPTGQAPGRFVIFEGAAHITLRMDTATGKTWKISSTESFTKSKSGDSIYIDHWEEFPEKDAMEWMLKNPDQVPKQK